ncbi:MAG: SRPBCC domain-containing protein [Bacteroidia bacterium]|nr:SRPBCC domain-containing protein [Bacteroidia bacterium]MCF8446088.1 SRPBCC domain-containing protein [Bacteroidia bacterium]
MKNFNWTTFTKKIIIKSELSDMYGAWTKACELEKWFLSKAVYKEDGGLPIDKDQTVEKGGTYEWNWYLFEVTEYGQITEANGKDFVQFTFAGSCLVDIQLSTQDEYVLVELTQKNIPTDDNSKQGIRLGCESGWSFFLVNLKSVYEGGLDLRNKDTQWKGLVNN